MRFLLNSAPDLFISSERIWKWERWWKANRIEVYGNSFVLHDCIFPKLDVLIYCWVADHKSSGLQWHLLCSGISNVAGLCGTSSSLLHLASAGTAQRLGLNYPEAPSLPGQTDEDSYPWDPSWHCQLITHGWFLPVASILVTCGWVSRLVSWGSELKNPLSFIT